MYLNLASILQGSADQRPDAVALRMGEQALTYAELERAARGVAGALRAVTPAPIARVRRLAPGIAPG